VGDRLGNALQSIGNVVAIEILKACTGAAHEQSLPLLSSAESNVTQVARRRAITPRSFEAGQAKAFDVFPSILVAHKCQVFLDPTYRDVRVELLQGLKCCSGLFHFTSQSAVHDELPIAWHNPGAF
jgi:hypothetical protein